MSKKNKCKFMVLKRESNVSFDDYINIEEEFAMSEIVSGTFVSYHSYESSKMIYALFDLDDGRKTSVWMHYFRVQGTKMYYLVPGDRVTLKCKGYNVRLHHTAWNAFAIPMRLRFIETQLTKVYAAVSSRASLDEEHKDGTVLEGCIINIVHQPEEAAYAQVQLSYGRAIKVPADEFEKALYSFADIKLGDKIRMIKLESEDSDDVASDWQIVKNKSRLCG